MAAVDVIEVSTSADMEVHTAVLKKNVNDVNAAPVGDTTPMSQAEVTYLS